MTISTLASQTHRTFAAAADDTVINKIIEAAMEGHVRAEDIAQVTGLSREQVYEGNRRLRRRIDGVAAKRRQS
jgi:hypothetical protein